MTPPKLTLTSPVSRLPAVGPAFATHLARLGISSVRDLLYHVPNRYEDFRLIAKASSLQEGETVTLQGRVVEIKNVFTRSGFVLQTAKVADDTGTVDVLWFNQRFLTRIIKKGDFVSLSGVVKRAHHGLALESPDYEILREGAKPVHTARLVPIYPETQGISSKWLRARLVFLINAVKTNLLPVPEFLDQDTLKTENLLGLKDALLKLHYPSSLEDAEAAKNRLAFDELLVSTLEAKSRHAARKETKVTHPFVITPHRPALTTFVNNLPFKLTPAQKRVVSEIFKDLASDSPMNRLLQGDVGSGKTVVAALAMLATYLNGYQAVLMAPTEILAFQHFDTLKSLLSPLGIDVGIVTGSSKNFAGLDIIVGTHALLVDKLTFPKLGLIVIDESHRFGVAQRAKLTSKAATPHVLTMTATPIPRTIALTLFGDLDISIIDTLPVGRKPVKTWVVPKAKRAAAYSWVESQKTQSFIICPLIEESDAESLQSVKSAKAEFETLKRVFPSLRLGLLHGRLKPLEKDKVLSAFRDGQIDILVATPVVEVGLDIPGATIIIIEAADRFGLAQLHQLRGRVGRRGQDAYCLLFTESDSPSALARLKNLEKLHSGLKLAEVDLKFRGPGTRFGTAQHGRWDFDVADFTNLDLIEKANLLAEKVIVAPERFPLLKKMLADSKIKIAPN